MNDSQIFSESALIDFFFIIAIIFIPIILLYKYLDRRCKFDDKSERLAYCFVLPALVFFPLSITSMIVGGVSILVWLALVILVCLNK